MKKTMFSAFLGAAALLAGCGDDPPKAPEGSDHPLYQEMCGILNSVDSCEAQEACLDALQEGILKMSGLNMAKESPDKSHLPAVWRDITQAQMEEAQGKAKALLSKECAAATEWDTIKSCLRRMMQPLKELLKCQ